MCPPGTLRHRGDSEVTRGVRTKMWQGMDRSLPPYCRMEPSRPGRAVDQREHLGDGVGILDQALVGGPHRLAVVVFSDPRRFRRTACHRARQLQADARIASQRRPWRALEEEQAGRLGLRDPIGVPDQLGELWKASRRVLGRSFYLRSNSPLLVRQGRPVGSPAACHSGRPSSNLRAVRPASTRTPTASCANAQNGPRQ
jgi:hypothetical protein